MTKPVQLMLLSEVGPEALPFLSMVARGETRVRIEQEGKPLAALISAADLDRLSQFEREREGRFAVVDRMRDAFKDVPSDELEREIVDLIREIRSEEGASHQNEKQIAADRRSA